MRQLVCRQNVGSRLFFTTKQDTTAPKPRYPMEDMELPGADKVRFPPAVSTHDVDAAQMGNVLYLWNFLQIFGKPVSLAPFPLDDFVAALKHTDRATPCALLSETHAMLLRVIYTATTKVGEAEEEEEMRVKTALKREGVNPLKDDWQRGLCIFLETVLPPLHASRADPQPSISRCVGIRTMQRR